MKVFIASDHAGFSLKTTLVEYLREQGHEVTDMGAHELRPDDDYPDFIAPCASRVADEEGAFGIVIGWSGHGEAMVANRVGGVRAINFYGLDPREGYDIVRLGREHNDANVLSLGAHFVSSEQAVRAVCLFLETPFSGDVRHVRRLRKF